MRHPNRTLAIGTAGTLVAGLVALAPVAHAAGNVDTPPLRSVSGGLSGPIGIENDAAGNLYIASQLNNRVVVHAAGASGDAGPLRTLTGPATGISLPRDVALDGNGFLWVVNNNGTINVFGPGQSGNATPVRTFGTGAGSARGIDIAASGEVYVRKTDAINVYSPAANGSPAPTLRSITGLAVGNAIHVRGGRIWVPNGTQLRAYATNADGAAAPLQTIVDAFVGANEINGIDTDQAGRVYATTFSTRTVKVYAPAANGVADPLKVLGGPATGLEGPTGLTVLPNGDVAIANYFAPMRVATFAKLFDDRTRPGKVRSLRVKGTAKAKKRTIAWKAPASDGGANVTSYRVVVKKGGKTLLTRNVTSPKRKFVVKRKTLRKGVHTVRVQAKNVKGHGPVAKKQFRVRK